jgi:hypothetical protein
MRLLMLYLLDLLKMLDLLDLLDMFDFQKIRHKYLVITKIYYADCILKLNRIFNTESRKKRESKVSSVNIFN